MIPSNEPDIQREDGTPPLAAQCKTRNWKFDYYNFGKAEEPGVDWFNPGLVQRPDGLWLLVRRSRRENLFGKNEVCAILLDEAGHTPRGGQVIKWEGAEGEEQHEDARAAYHPGLNQTAICACSFVWYGDGTGWTGATQVVGFFDQDWECKVKHRPPIEGNPPSLHKIEPKFYQKNWVIFFHDGKLHLLYKSRPWVIFRFGQTWSENESFMDNEGVSWPFGDIRGGTPPVLVDGLYWTFFHSSLPWKGNYRRYFAGAVAFESQPPFKPVLITKEPILAGSQNDIWEQRKPPCVFPCGSVIRNGTWLVTMGVNDMKAAWAEIPHADLVKLMSPIHETNRNNMTIFPATGLSEQEQRLMADRATKPVAPATNGQVTKVVFAEPTLKEKRQAQAAKMRAAKEAKRAIAWEKTEGSGPGNTGWKPIPPQKKRHIKRRK